MNYGRYQIENEVGRGSMGVVYRAHDPQIDRTVALKVLRQDKVTSEAFVKRFLKEAKAIGRLSHPNIVAVHDVGEDQGSIYIAMEFLEGEPLHEVIQKGRLGLKDAVDLVIQVAETLDYAHQKGVVHRDIKPSNIILTPDGHVKITDFGIAHVDDPSATVHTMVGEIMGTPAYMSPQQVLGQPTDGRTDLFSLGVILYELCTGKRPFGGEGKNLATVFNEIVKENPPDPALASGSVPKELSTIIMKCLGKAPEDRYQTGRELAEVLRGTCEEKPTQTTVASQALVQPQPRKTTFIQILLAVVVTLVAVGGYLVWERIMVPQRRATVQVESTPPGAEIYINGEVKGKTPVPLQLPLGQHRLLLVLSGFQEREVQLELNEAKLYPVPVVLQPSAPSPPKPGILKVESTPPGAEVYVDGERRGTAPGKFETSPGSHHIRVVLPGYADYSTQVQLPAASEYPLKAELIPEPPRPTGVASLTVTTEPSGAELYLDGKLKGRTPQQLEAAVGWHQLRLVLEGYGEKEEHIQLGESKPYQLSYELKPQLKKPVLLADSDPGGAAIYVNDQYKGKAPLRLRLPAGKYLVRMTLSGYQEWSSQVEVGETGEFPVTGGLKALQGEKRTVQGDKAYFNVQSTPSSATVFVDGDLKGTTPLKITVSPGKHRVRVTLQGHQSWEHQVQVKQIREYPINILLKPGTDSKPRNIRSPRDRP
jgi:tRNA A-37 threonylcarbamoyl transferase component Bud32